MVPGTYKFKFDRENYYSQEKEIIVYAGRTETLNVELIPQKGSVSLIVEPDSLQLKIDVLIDGISYGNPPIVRTLTAGTHSVTAIIDGKSFNQPVNIIENTDSPIKFVFDKNEKLVISQTQLADTSVSVKKNFKPLYYLSAVAIAGGAYYYYAIYKPNNEKTTINIDFELP